MERDETGTERVGILRFLAGGAFIEPDAPRAKPVMVVDLDPKFQRGGVRASEVIDGALVSYEVTVRATAVFGAKGKILDVLGPAELRKREFQRVVCEFHLVDGFPDLAQDAASRLAHMRSPKSEPGRRDLRELPFVTIDQEDARDFDDAVFAERLANGNYRLCVAIADVSYYVQPKDPIDDEALRRGTSTYFPDRVFPMLPEILSNDLCSLRPHVDRYAVVADLEITSDGALGHAHFFRATIRSQARLTYSEVAAALDGKPSPSTVPRLAQLLVLYHVAQLRLKKRLERGGIDLDLPEAEMVFGPDGMPTHCRQRARSDAHRLVEDLMLSANEAVARYFVENKLPTLFRIHEKPDLDKLRHFVGVARALGIPLSVRHGRVKPVDLAKMVATLDAHPTGRRLHGLVLRTLAQARYYPENEGHFGLAASHYLHFTSPIRRYPDLMVHRLLLAHLDNQTPGYTKDRLHEIAEHASLLERHAAKAEQAARALDRCYVATLHVGSRFFARITNVQPFGVFVETETPFLDGMIPVRTLGRGPFSFDESTSTLADERSHDALHIGDDLVVELVRVDIAKRAVEFARIAASPARDAPTPPRTRKSARPTKPTKRRSGRGSQARGPNPKSKHAHPRGARRPNP